MICFFLHFFICATHNTAWHLVLDKSGYIQLIRRVLFEIVWVQMWKENHWIHYFCITSSTDWWMYCVQSKAHLTWSKQHCLADLVVDQWHCYLWLNETFCFFIQSSATYSTIHGLLEKWSTIQLKIAQNAKTTSNSLFEIIEIPLFNISGWVLLLNNCIEFCVKPLQRGKISTGSHYHHSDRAFMTLSRHLLCP